MLAMNALTKLLAVFLAVFRFLAWAPSHIVVVAMIPFKLWAYRAHFRFVKRLLLEITSFFDFVLVFANVQNEAMLIYRRIYRGNFIFGKSVMLISHQVATEQIVLPTLRGNRFMGVDIVSNDPGAFVTNAGPITTSAPARTLARQHIDSQIMTDRVRSMDLDALRVLCNDTLAEWVGRSIYGYDVVDSQHGHSADAPSPGGAHHPKA